MHFRSRVGEKYILWNVDFHFLLGPWLITFSSIKFSSKKRRRSWDKNSWKNYYPAVDVISCAPASNSWSFGDHQNPARFSPTDLMTNRWDSFEDNPSSLKMEEEAETWKVWKKVGWAVFLTLAFYVVSVTDKKDVSPKCQRNNRRTPADFKQQKF